MLQIVFIDWIVGELNGVMGFEPLFDVGQHAFVVTRPDVQGLAEGFGPDFPVFDDDLPSLDHPARQLEVLLTIVLHLPNRLARARLPG